MINIEQEIISNYTNNMEFLKEKHIEVYNLVSTLSMALETNQIEESFSLEYKDNSYFDIFDIKNKSFLYDMDSNIFSNTLEKNLDLSTNKNIFQTLDNNLEQQGKAYEMEEFFNYIKKDKNKQYDHINKFIFLGSLLGMHIPKIIKKLSVRECFIYEPNLEMFRLSLFTTQYYTLKDNIKFNFSIMRDENEFEIDMKSFLDNNSNLNYCIKFYAIPLYEHLVSKISMFLSLEQPELMHFRKRLTTFQHTVEKITNKNYIINFDKIDLNLEDKEVLLLAAGPSLEKNIKWIQNHQDKYIIFAVGAILKLLYQYNIKPDIIVQTHFNDDLLAHYIDVPYEFYQNSILFAADQVPKSLLDLHNVDRIFIYPATNLIYLNYHQIDGDNVGNVALYMLCLLKLKSINIIGLDMALSDDGSTHVSTHQSSKNMTNQTLLQVKGNLRENVETTPIYYQSYLNTQMIIDKFNNKKINNLSDGVYLNHTIPVDVNLLDMQCKHTIDKEEFINNTITNLLVESSQGLSQADKIIFQQIVKSMDQILSNKNISFENVINFINSILINKNYHKEYKDLVYNYTTIITPYIDKFLNNSNFSYKNSIKHKKALYNMLLKHLIQLTQEFRNVFKSFEKVK